MKPLQGYLLAAVALGSVHSLDFGHVPTRFLKDASTDPQFALRGTKTRPNSQWKQEHKYTDVLPSLQYWRASPDLPPSAYPELGRVSADDTETRYLSFETDLGGWNNIRLQLEILFVLAHATGRVLLIPAPQVLYLLDTPAKDLSEYYDLAELKRGVKTMLVDEFVENEKSSGLISAADQAVLLQDCGFDCARDNGGHTLYASWMRKNAFVPGWNGMGQV
jgi:hypothetical protein